MSKLTGVRYAEVDRETGETSVRVVIDMDGGERRDIATGIGFFDSMLDFLASLGGMNVGIQAEGDLPVDDHHTVEDVGIVLGKAIREALGSEAIERYASNHTAKDDALVLVAIDVCGRGQLHWEASFRRENLGGLSTENVREFFRALCTHGGFTLHVREIASVNDHHLCEAIFKGVGRAIHKAARVVERRGVNSKGKLD